MHASRHFRSREADCWRDTYKDAFMRQQLDELDRLGKVVTGEFIKDQEISFGMIVVA